jgi:hypothetical protein
MMTLVGEATFLLLVKERSHASYTQHFGQGTVDSNSGKSEFVLAYNESKGGVDTVDLFFTASLQPIFIFYSLATT